VWETFIHLHLTARQTDCNFFSYRLSNVNQGHALDSDGSWYLGDFVNRLIPGKPTFSLLLGMTVRPLLGAVVQVKESRFKPKQLFFSSTGRIGLVSIVEETDLSLQLISLQRNMAQVLIGTGNVQHTKYAVSSCLCTSPQRSPVL
jgi:DNA damage-binding protein 1